MRAIAAFGFLVACGATAGPTTQSAPYGTSAAPPAYSTAPTASASPVQPRSSAVPTQISAGGEVTCARMSDATVRCWGKNQFGQVGEGAADEQKMPRAIPALSGVKQIAVGDAFDCALMDDATVRCWGSNYYGALGLGDENERLAPTPVPGLSDITQIATGSAACALHRDGRVSCWGDYDPGVGDPRSIGSKVPLDVLGIHDAVEVAVGRSHSCARRASGAVTCWRHVSPGLVPRGRVRADPVGVRVDDAAGISLGSSGAAVTKGGQVKCWASCAFELGRDGSADYSAAFVVPKTLHVVEVAISDDVACVRRDDGNVLCKDDKGALVPVPNVARATSIAAGAYHACALVPSGVVCWGENSAGQLGDGTTSKRAAPVAVRF